MKQQDDQVIFVQELEENQSEDQTLDRLSSSWYRSAILEGTS